MAFVDVSHPIIAGMETYPGLPPPRVEVVLDYDESRHTYSGASEFYIASLHACGNTGTYVDAPIHRFRGGADLASLPLERLADLPVVVVDARADRAIGPKAFTGLEVDGAAVLIRTDWSRHWDTAAYGGAHPFLTREAAEHLREAGAALVGIDSLNIDDRGDPARPVHTCLLGAGIPICEHMTNLGQVPGQGGRLHAVPIPWVGGASFPVRAYVVVP